GRGPVPDGAALAAELWGLAFWGLARAEDLAGDVDPPHLGQFRLGKVGDRLHPVYHAGIVEEGGHPAELSVDGLEQPHDVGFAADVGLDGDRAPAGLLDLLDDSFGAGRIAIVVDSDPIAARRPQLCCCSADAAAATCHD